MGQRVMLAIVAIWVALHATVASSSTDLVRLKNDPEECTIGVADGSVTADGRPLLWKVRDIGQEAARQQLVHISGSPYNHIGVCTEGEGIYMGLNEAGVASGNALVKFTSEPAPNSSVQSTILRSFATVDQIRGYFWSGKQAGTCTASGCFPFIDALGNATILEVNRSVQIWEYDSLDRDRRAQGLYGFVVRANEFHMRSNGMDNVGIGGRYASGVHNVLGLIAAGSLSVRGLVQGAGDAQDYHEFLRYGPGREMATIARDTTQSAVVVQGVLPDEDPTLATMWVMLGQTNYSIAVPTWARVSNVPECLRAGLMYDRARSLWLKANEGTIQASVIPLEAHLLEVVGEILLPHWRVYGVPDVNEMTRIEGRMADDAYSLLDCLDTRRGDNRAPMISFVSSPNDLTLTFTTTANDPDGAVVAMDWNFGDGCHSSETSACHTYVEPGTYLVSCTATDDLGVSVTSWCYYDVPASVENGAYEWGL